MQVSYSVASSLDGFIAGPGGELDWLHAFEHADTDYGLADFMATVDGVVMGRATHDVARSFGPWPYGDRPAWVLSRSPRPTDAPAPVRWEAGTPTAVCEQARAAGVRHLWLVGGGDVAGPFLAAGVVDALHLALMPVALGHGIGLWGRTACQPPRRWQLCAHRAHAHGVVTLEYRRAPAPPG